MPTKTQSKLYSETLPSIVEKFDHFPVADLPDVYAAPDPGMIASILHYGVLAPIILVETKEGYKVCDGLRRVASARAAKLESVPAVVYDFDPTTADTSTIMLNAKRSENPVAELQAIERVMGKAIGEAEIVKATGIQKSKISKLLKFRLLNPVLREYFDSYKLPPNLAARIVSKDFVDRQDEVIGLIEKNERLTSKQLDGLLDAKPKVETSPVLPGIETSEKRVEVVREIEVKPTILVSKLKRAIAYSLELTDAANLSSDTFNGIVDAMTQHVSAFLHKYAVLDHGNSSDVVEGVNDPKDTLQTTSASTVPEDGASATPTDEDPNEVDADLAAFSTVDYVVSGAITEESETEGGSAVIASDPDGSTPLRLNLNLEDTLKQTGIRGVDDLIKKLNDAGIKTVLDLNGFSVWRLMRDVGVSKGTAEKLFEHDLLDPHYDPNAKVSVGWGISSLLTAKSDPFKIFGVKRIVTGPQGGLYVEDLDGFGKPVQGSLTFWDWDKIKQFFNAI